MHSRRIVSRALVLADVSEFIAASVVAVLLAAAGGGAAEDGEQFHEEKTESREAGTHDADANFNGAPHGHVVEFPADVV
jgi:hypothetical protein